MKRESETQRKEEQMRLRRTKMEREVLAWIAKYDSEMGEKQNRIEEIESVRKERTK